MTGEIERYAADAVILATGGYGTAYYLSTNAVNSNVTAAWRAHKRGRALRQPVLHADPPDLHSGQRRASVEAHADEREPAQRRARLGAEEEGRQAPAGADSRRRSATTTSNGSIRASATWCRATSPRATPSRSCDDGRGVGESGLAVYLDFKDAIKRLGLEAIKEKYGNLFHMYQKITDEDAVQGADADLPGHPLHDGRALGRLQPDEQRAGPARARRSELLRPRREPARRERADAGAGRRLLRHPLHHRPLPGQQRRCRRSRPTTTRSRRRRTTSQKRITALLSVKGNRGIREIHRELGRIMWDDVGMARTEASLRRALEAIPKLREEFWQNVSVPGTPDNLNQSLEYAGRVADYLEFAELLALDALAPPRIVRRPLPRRKPDARRRGAARRRALHVRGGVGVQRRRQGSRCCTRSRWCSTKCTRRSGVTSRLKP